MSVRKKTCREPQFHDFGIIVLSGFQTTTAEFLIDETLPQNFELWFGLDDV